MRNLGVAFGAALGRRLFVFLLARYLREIVGWQWQLFITVVHSKVGHCMVEALKALRVRSPHRGLEGPAPGKVVQSDS